MSGYLACCCVEEPSVCNCTDAGRPFASVSAFVGFNKSVWRSSKGCEECASFPTLTNTAETNVEYCEIKARLECDTFSSFTQPNDASDRSIEQVGSVVDTYNNAQMFRKRCGCCPDDAPNAPGCTTVWMDQVVANGIDERDDVTTYSGQARHLLGPSGVGIPSPVSEQYERRFGEPLVIEPDMFYRVFIIPVTMQVRNIAGSRFTREERCSGIDVFTSEFNEDREIGYTITQVNLLGPSCDVTGNGTQLVTYIESVIFQGYEPADPLNRTFGILPYEGVLIDDFSGNCDGDDCGTDCPDVSPHPFDDVRTTYLNVSGGVTDWEVEP